MLGFLLRDRLYIRNVDTQAFRVTNQLGILSSQAENSFYRGKWCPGEGRSEVGLWPLEARILTPLLCTESVSFHAHLNWTTLVASLAWIIYATGLSRYKGVCSSQSMDASNQPPSRLVATCPVLLCCCWAGWRIFYITTQQSIKNLASQVAATDKRTAAMDEFTHQYRLLPHSRLFRNDSGMLLLPGQRNTVHAAPSANSPSTCSCESTHNQAVLIQLVFGVAWTDFNQAEASASFLCNYSFMFQGVHVNTVREENQNTPSPRWPFQSCLVIVLFITGGHMWHSDFYKTGFNRAALTVKMVTWSIEPLFYKTSIV